MHTCMCAHVLFMCVICACICMVSVYMCVCMCTCVFDPHESGLSTCLCGAVSRQTLRKRRKTQPLGNYGASGSGGPHQKGLNSDHPPPPQASPDSSEWAYSVAGSLHVSKLKTG